jgi:hypothetical protein
LKELEWEKEKVPLNVEGARATSPVSGVGVREKVVHRHGKPSGNTREREKTTERE